MRLFDDLAYGSAWSWYRPGRLVSRSRKATQLGAAVAYATFHRRALPVTYVDVGARWGPRRHWAVASRLGFADIVLVEPDADEAAELRARFPRATVVAAALGARPTRQTLYITAEPAVSSMLEPDGRLVEQLGVDEQYAVQRTIEIDVTTFEELCDRAAIDRTHFVKIDVQGFEGAVLEGFGARLAGVLGIELEVALQRTYRGQPGIGDINDQLLEAGFAPVDIRPLGSARAGIIEANAFYERRAPMTDRDRTMIEFWRLLLGVRTNAALVHAL